MTIIVSLMGRKGGITKTTLAKNIAAHVAREGYSVILVDADGQGNATHGVRVDREDGFKALIMEGADWNSVLRPVPAIFTGKECDHFYVLPAFDGQLEVEKYEDTPGLIYQRMQQLRGAVDLVICDLPPGLANTHIGLYYASDYVILPTLCEFDSVLSLDSTIQYLMNAAQAGERAGYKVAKVLGIAPNRLNAAEKTQQANVGWVSGRYYERFKVFTPMRDLAVWRKASQLRRSIYAVAEEGVYAERMEARKAIAELGAITQPLLELLQAVV